MALNDREHQGSARQAREYEAWREKQTRDMAEMHQLIQSEAPWLSVDMPVKLNNRRRLFDYASSDIVLDIWNIQRPPNPPQVAQRFIPVAGIRSRLWTIALAQKTAADSLRAYTAVIIFHPPDNERDAKNMAQLEWEAAQFNIRLIFVNTPTEAAKKVLELQPPLDLDDVSDEFDMIE